MKQVNRDIDPQNARILGMRGAACVRTEADVMQIYNQRVARKYVLTPGGLRNWLSHPRQLWLRRYYTAASNQKGRAAVIEVIPQEIFWQVQP
jgi:hypothetical protein